MSFTSHVVPIGEGWEGPSKVEEDPAQIYNLEMAEAAAKGALTSSKDPKGLFSDSYVDMAKEAEEEIEESEAESKKLLFWRKKKKKKFYN